MNTDSRTASGNCSLLVLSWDNCSDLWAPFFNLLDRFWPDCPFEVYLGSNKIRYQSDKVTTLLSGDQINWTECVKLYLDNIKTPYVLMMLEDFLIRKPVDSIAVLNCLEKAQTLDAVSFRLIPKPGPNRKLAGESLIGECDRRAFYRVSTQAAIWNVEELRKLLHDHESPWAFEINGTERSRAIEGRFFSVKTAVIPYHRHAVVQGKWFYDDARLFRRLDVGCDFSKRPVLSLPRTLWWHYRDIVHSVFVSPKTRLKQALFGKK